MDIVERLRSVTRLLCKKEDVLYDEDNKLAFESADEIERLREEVDELVKERNRYKRVCLKIVGDSKEESDISDFVLYLAKEALKEGE